MSAKRDDLGYLPNIRWRWFRRWHRGPRAPAVAPKNRVMRTAGGDVIEGGHITAIGTVIGGGIGTVAGGLYAERGPVGHIIGSGPHGVRSAWDDIFGGGKSQATRNPFEPGQPDGPPKDHHTGPGINVHVYLDSKEITKGAKKVTKTALAGDEPEEPMHPCSVGDRQESNPPPPKRKKPHELIIEFPDGPPEWTPVHRPKWIAPHVKGPADKPLVVKETIYAWTR